MRHIKNYNSFTSINEEEGIFGALFGKGKYSESVRKSAEKKIAEYEIKESPYVLLFNTLKEAYDAKKEAILPASNPPDSNWKKGDKVSFEEVKVLFESLCCGIISAGVSGIDCIKNKEGKYEIQAGTGKTAGGYGSAR